MIGERIREVRKERGLTLDHLAERSGVSRSYLSQIETGARPGSIEAVRAVSTALGVPLDQLFSGVDIQGDELDLLDAYRALSSSDRTAMLRHAQALLRQQELQRIMK